MIYHFHPIHRPMIWGAEEWILSAYPGRDSICIETGKNIWHMLCEQREQLVGKHVFARYGDTFPLLIKFIDAHDDLSVQVHPSDAWAQKYGEPFGKTEMWYVLPSEPGARLYCGLKHSLTPEAYKRMVADNSLLEALACYEVQDGDCYFIPAGRIHAIGNGCRLCEIQQTSDTTYRIYDYDRRDKDGHPRELHTERAAECINYNDVESAKQDGNGENLVSCPYFTTNVLHVNGATERDYSKLDSFVCLICLNGEGQIAETGDPAGTETTEVPLKEGTLLLLSATTHGVRISGTMRMLEVYIQ